MEPVPTPVITNAPVNTPVNAPVNAPTPNTGGCCTWSGNQSCGPTWCNENKSNCEGNCNGNYNSNLAPSVPTPTPPAPTPGVATTTRYWDCRYVLILEIN